MDALCTFRASCIVLSGERFPQVKETHIEPLHCDYAMYIQLNSVL
jgi:hypothetical protein